MSSDAPLPNSGLPPAQPPWPHQTRQIHHDLPQRGPAAAAASGLQPQQNQPPSPFLRLPSEIRLLVYSYLLPHASTITFHPLTRKHPSTGTPTPAHAVHIPGVWASIGIWTGLLRTCRQLHAEGIDALYGRNLFHFSLTSKERVWAFTPAAPASPAADQGSTARRGGGGGGPVAANGASGGGGVNALNTPHARGLPVNTLRTSGIGPAALRRMRAVVLRIEEDLSRPESYRRVQAWLREWVERLNAAGGHCLQELRVELVSGVFRYGGFPSFTHSVFWEFLPERSHDAGAQWQFVLEPLAELGGLREVEVRGHVKPEFAKRLAGKMMAGATADDGCGMDGIEYAERKVERKTGPVARSTRKFYEPELDWQLQGD
ncbi:hypothetical protein B0J12DRAFT_434968 [Macrophomina phaseolina]|uniref:Uncharacterized protein n=1 Tax=Macrophomina phaseolina TaxID=35725 RepID=A0ABQ8GHD4_9PEZI|nr:hypothetical protein B0J12DRAFT_434968 [Macrophomina phaseolina]